MIFKLLHNFYLSLQTFFHSDCISSWETMENQNQKLRDSIHSQSLPEVVTFIVLTTSNWIEVFSFLLRCKQCLIRTYWCRYPVHICSSLSPFVHHHSSQDFIDQHLVLDVRPHRENYEVTTPSLIRLLYHFYTGVNQWIDQIIYSW